jgi:plasmid stabilization system protein ParE
VTLRASSHPRADEELLEAVAFYEDAEPGLGASFLDEVERSFGEIVERPEACPLVSRTARRKLLRRFPYALIYSLPQGRVRILAVAHLKRRPLYWRDRR